VPHRLAESDPRVKADSLLGNAGGDRDLESFLQERRHLRDDVLVARVVLHRPRLAEHVHEAEEGALLGYNRSELGVGAESGHVIDHDGAVLECVPGDFRFGGIDRDRWW
jgi:hypothetical protein